MEALEIKKLMIDSLSEDQSVEPGKIGSEVSYDFSFGFKERVLKTIYPENESITKEVEFSRFLSIAFSRIALTGVAAIVLLLISLFLTEGSISFDTLLGITDASNEDIVLLLTGN
ncbi:MAG TPA: hypothetical protein VHO50_02465 [Bacteroidales bacterium]|nr:hypothetical protein [Bacteroidales bacterium]